MLNFSDKDCRRIVWIFMGVMAAVILLTFRDYGITWDEELQSQYGLAVVDYYASFFKDRRFAEIFNLYLYGGMFDGLASIVDRFTPFSLYETRHLMNAFVGLLGLWGTWRLGRLLGGSVAGLLAMFFLILTPMYYGHMYNNPKDVPFAAGVVWTLYYMARLLGIAQALPRERWRLIVKLGIALGLTLGIRVGGIMLFGFWLVPLVLDSLRPLVERRNSDGLRAALKQGWHYALTMVLPVAVLAYAVMLVCWPWAQQHPIINPLRALGEFSNFPQDVEVLLDGTIYRSTQLPWTYVPLYFAVQLPEFLLMLMTAGLLLLPWIVRGLDHPKRQALLIVLLTAFTAPLYAMIRHPALYDAVRHFLFTVPMFCILAALGAKYMGAWLLDQFPPMAHRNVRLGLFILFLTVAAVQLVIMRDLHPYEYIYANRFAGSLRGVFGRYELDYWGSSFKEAAAKLQDYVAREGGVPPGKMIRVAICGPWDAAMIYLPPDYQPVVANEPADFFLATTRWLCQDMRPGKDIIIVKRLGAPLSVVKDLRGGYEVMPEGKK